MTNISRREAAKAITIGSVAAFISPAALAADPDAELIALEKQRNHILDVEYPPLAEAYDKAEETVMEAVPYQSDPGETLAEIDDEEARTIALLNEDSREGQVIELVWLARKDVQGTIAEKVSAAFNARRNRVRQYDEYIANRAQVEAECGLQEKAERMHEAYDRADTLCDQIMEAKPRTIAGLAVQLRMIKYHYIELGAVIPNEWIDGVIRNADAIA